MEEEVFLSFFIFFLYIVAWAEVDSLFFFSFFLLVHFGS